MMLRQRLTGDVAARREVMPAVDQAAGAVPRVENSAPDTVLDRRGVLTFGPFRLDPMRRTLLRDGVAVPLSGRLFETLLYLAQHPERLVAREELENAVWCGRAVEEGNLQKAISSLRKVLQAGTQGDSYIVTIAGRGFRFTAPVLFEPCGRGDSISNISPGPVEAGVAPAGTPRPWLHWRKLRVGAVALLVAAAVTVWRLPPRHTDLAAFAPPAHSVAILPFVNMSGDAKEDYFSDGLADELINTLSRVGGLRVAARTSAFSFKRSNATIGDIGRRLDVGAILEGAVRRDGQRVHIAVQLIDTRTGFQFWSRSYDRDRFLDDILKVQTDIAETVSTSLETRLLHAEAARLGDGGTHNAQAFDAYLRGMKNSADYGEANLRQAIADFGAAITLDPGYAQAFAERASALNVLVVTGLETDAEGDQRDAAAAVADADAAIRLAPNLAEAHRVKSVILFDALSFKGAAEELSIARELAPNDARVEASDGAIEGRFGHTAVALEAVRRAVALDPLNPAAYQRVGQDLYWSGHFDAALEAYGHANSVEMHPSRLNMSWIAFALLAKGDAAAAVRICAGGTGWSDDESLAIAYHALGRQPEAEAKLAKLHQAFGDRAAYQYAQIYAQWGQPVEAMRWLETAYKVKDSGLNEMKVSPFLDPIRNLAEFGEIERRLNFPL
jgi:TolB-like protein/DNA-binding winged helix-turn-helix (wHTH) protein/Flp pilus assembly protein TadD